MGEGVLTLCDTSMYRGWRRSKNLIFLRDIIYKRPLSDYIVITAKETKSLKQLIRLGSVGHVITHNDTI